MVPPYVEHSEVHLHDIATEGQNLTLTCDEGYRFRDGTKIRDVTCAEGGEWMLDTDEKCRGMQRMQMKKFGSR